MFLGLLFGLWSIIEVSVGQEREMCMKGGKGREVCVREGEEQRKWERSVCKGGRERERERER